MAGQDTTPDSLPAVQAEHSAAKVAQDAAEAETKARMLKTQGYVADPLSTPEETEEDTATISQPEESATGGIDWDFLKSASKEQYDAYVETLTPEQAKVVLRGLPIAGVRSFSGHVNDVIDQEKALALKTEEYQQELQRLASQLIPAPVTAPAPEPGEWTDPKVAVLERKLAEIEARDQQRSIAEGLGAIGSEMHTLAEEHPFFAGMGAIGAQKLFTHMQRLNTPNTRVAFKDLFETELDAEKEERIVERIRGQQKKAASLPHVTPTGTSRRQPSEIPVSTREKKEQLKSSGVAQRLWEHLRGISQK